jgi:serine/threonine-protein kinase
MAASTGRPAPSLREQAAIAHDDAHNLFRNKQYSQSIVLASKCLSLDPGNARCHMLMAASYARLEKPEQAAKHYREFLRYAPNDPNAARIRELLSNYDKQQSR